MTAKKYKTEEERKEANREAQRRFARTEKGKKYHLEKGKKWAKKKRETDPEYFKKWQKIEQHISKRTELNYVKKIQKKLGNGLEITKEDLLER